MKVRKSVTDVDLTYEYKRSEIILLKICYKAFKTWLLVELKWISTSFDLLSSAITANDTSLKTILGVILKVEVLKVIS